MLTVLNEETSECFIEESPPLAPELDSGARVNPRLIADNQPNKTNAVGLVRGGLPPRVLRHVREHIDANIEQRISVEALAKLANLSVWYFVRAFKQSVGLTPHNYLILRRVERTLELLSGTELSVSEIALAAGFADQSHCARRLSRTLRHVAARVPMVDAVSAGNTLLRIVESVTNGSDAARLESPAASCGLRCQRLSENREHASLPTVYTDRGQHLG